MAPFRSLPHRDELAATAVLASTLLCSCGGALGPSAQETAIDSGAPRDGDGGNTSTGDASGDSASSGSDAGLASCSSPAKPGASPVQFGKAPQGNGFLAVDCSSLYVGPYESGAVTAFSLADGSARTLNPVAATTLAIDATRVYSVSPSGGSEPQGLVIACPKAGCGSGYTTLATGQTNVWGVAVDEADVYWTNQGAPGAVMKASLSGGAPTTLVGPGSATNIAVSGGQVVYAAVTGASSGSAVLTSVPVTGGTPNVLFTPAGGNSVQSLAVDRANAYVSTTDGLVVQVPLDGGTPITLATGQGDTVTGIAVDDMSVYWGNAGGDILKIPISGGAVTTLAAGGFAATAVAVDADNVYWLSSPNAELMMRAK